MKTWKRVLALMALAVFLVIGGPGVAPAEIVTTFEGVVRVMEVHSEAFYGPAPFVGQVVEAVAEPCLCGIRYRVFGRGI